MCNFCVQWSGHGIFCTLLISRFLRWLILWRICWTWKLASLWMCVCQTVCNAWRHNNDSQLNATCVCNIAMLQLKCIDQFCCPNKEKQLKNQKTTTFPSTRDMGKAELKQQHPFELVHFRVGFERVRISHTWCWWYFCLPFSQFISNSTLTLGALFSLCFFYTFCFVQCDLSLFLFFPNAWRFNDKSFFRAHICVRVLKCSSRDCTNACIQ